MSSTDETDATVGPDDAERVFERIENALLLVAVVVHFIRLGYAAGYEDCQRDLLRAAGRVP